MEHTQSDLAVEVREVPRCFPAILGCIVYRCWNQLTLARHT